MTLSKFMTLISIVSITATSCNNSDKNSSFIFDELSESFERSNKNLEISTNDRLNHLEAKRREPATAERANVWAGRANSVVENTKKIIDFVDTLQLAFIKMNKADKERKSFELDTLLKKYQASVLSSDLYDRKGFANRINFHGINVNSSSDLSRIKTSFLKIKNDIRNMENMAVVFCENQVGCLDCGGYEKFQAIAVSNSSIFKRGQEMLIQAGVGEFNMHSKPTLEINGLDIAPNDNGVGEYKMKIKNQPGDYKVHVKIRYTAQDGKQSSLEKDIEYAVVE